MASVALLSISFLDLVEQSHRLLPFVDSRQLFPPTPLLEFLQSQDRPFRVASRSREVARSNQLLPYGVERVDVYHAYIPPPATNGKDVLPIEYSNVKFLVTSPIEQREGDTNRFKLVYDGVDGKVYELKRSLPRAFLVPMAEDATIERVIGHVESLSAEEILKLIERPVQVEYRGNSEVLASINSDHRQLLVLLDRNYPGWKVSVDSRERQIHSVFGVMRAVEIRKDDKLVRFFLEPEILGLGLLLSLAAVVTCIVIIVFSWKERDVAKWVAVAIRGTIRRAAPRVR